MNLKKLSPCEGSEKPAENEREWEAVVQRKEKQQVSHINPSEANQVVQRTTGTSRVSGECVHLDQSDDAAPSVPSKERESKQPDGVRVGNCKEDVAWNGGTSPTAEGE